MSKKGRKKDKKRKIREIEKALNKKHPLITDKSGKIIPEELRWQKHGIKHRIRAKQTSELSEKVERKASLGEAEEQERVTAEDEQLKPYGVSYDAEKDPYINQEYWADNVELMGKFFSRVNGHEYCATLDYYHFMQGQEWIARKLDKSQPAISQMITKMWDRLRKKYKGSDPEFWEYCLEIRASRPI